MNRHLLTLLVSALFVGGALASTGCEIAQNTTGSGGTGAGTGNGAGGESADGGGGSGAGGPLSAKEMFLAIEAQMLDECGGCHDTSGISDAPFLAEPDRYASITTWPGIVTKDLSKSILIPHSKADEHGYGDAPSISPDLEPKVQAWLEEESKNLPEPTGPLVAQTTPFKPILGGALNTIYLDEIDPSLEYASISFYAKELSPTLLQLKNLEVHPIEGQAIHIIHPLFVVYPEKAEAEPDPIDSFSGVDQVFTLDQPDLALGTGELILTNWQKDAYLGMAFESIVNEGTGGPLAGCNDVTTFQTEVVPQMTYCANTCHGGANAQANATMDLSELMAMPPDAACAQVRARITPGDPESSQILKVTNPQEQIVHMYKFMGNKTKYQAFKDAVTPWILSEGQ